MSFSIPFPLGWLLNKKAARVEVNISLVFLHWVKGSVSYTHLTLPFPCTRRIMIRTGMRANIKLIRKHPKICGILRCESPYFHHWLGQYPNLPQGLGQSPKRTSQWNSFTDRMPCLSTDPTNSVKEPKAQRNSQLFINH